MTDARRRRRLVATTAITLLAVTASSGARATCMSVSGNYLFALNGEACTASGAYNATTPIPGAPPQPIVGLYAVGGSSITDSPGATFVTVTVPAPANPATASYAVWSDGVAGSAPFAPSNIDLAVPVTISTSGSNSYGFYATGGGAITASDVKTVTTSGVNSIAVFASGAASAPAPSTASTIALSGAAILTSGVDAFGVFSDSGASVVLSGGSVMTTNDGSVGVASFFGSTLSATGTSITTTGSADSSGARATAVWIAGTSANGAPATGSERRTGDRHSDQ
jgi:hypothetical protein